MLNGLLIIGSALIVTTVVIHVIGLSLALAFFHTWGGRIVTRGKYAGLLIVLSVTVLGIFFLHALEMFCWALLYMWLGEFETLERALYFSAVTFTTLGYGDITLNRDWQLLSGFEAANGIILVGVSTAFIFAILRGLHGAVFKLNID